TRRARPACASHAGGAPQGGAGAPPHGRAAAAQGDGRLPARRDRACPGPPAPVPRRIYARRVRGAPASTGRGDGLGPQDDLAVLTRGTTPGTPAGSRPRSSVTGPWPCWPGG